MLLQDSYFNVHLCGNITTANLIKGCLFYINATAFSFSYERILNISIHWGITKRAQILTVFMLKEITSYVHILVSLSLFLCITTVLLPKRSHVASGSLLHLSALQNPVQQHLSCAPELSETFHGICAVTQVKRPHTACQSAQLNGDKETAAMHVICSLLVCRGPILTAE